MGLALGAGQVVARMRIPCAPAILTVECERLPAVVGIGGGGLPVGGPDADGYDLHLRYVATRASVNDKSPESNPVLTIEFDVTPVVLLPFCGEIFLVGGSGNYRWSLSLPEKYTGAYVPEWRALSRWLKRATRFQIPTGHTRIGSLNANVNINAADGDRWQLDGSPKPCTPGQWAVAGASNVRIFTLAYL